MPTEGYEVGLKDTIEGSQYYTIYGQSESAYCEYKCAVIGRHKILRAVQAKMYGTPLVIGGVKCDVESIKIRSEDRASLTLIPHEPPTNIHSHE